MIYILLIQTPENSREGDKSIYKTIFSPEQLKNTNLTNLISVCGFKLNSVMYYYFLSSLENNSLFGAKRTHASFSLSSAI